MFFRLKETKSGQVLKLIESYRDEASVPRHRTVVSLGDAPIERSSWKPIAKTVEDRLYGRDDLITRDLSEDEQQWTDRLVRQVESEGRWSAAGQAEHAGPVIDGVLANEVSHTTTAELGTVLVGWQTWKKLGMDQLLGALGFNRAQSDAAAISVLNRLIDPVSEHSLLDWYRQTSLPELMGNRLRGAGDDRFYRISDKLLDNQEAIEKHLCERQRSMFNLQRTVLLYDLTNTHFEGVCKRNPKAKRGMNKQKRNDCPQVVVGMLFDQFGFEMAHKVFEGSMNDGKSLVEMIGLFDAATDGDEKPIVVLDGGIATRENLRLLRQHGFSYLVNDSRRQRGRYREQFADKKGFRAIEGREGKTPVSVRLMDDPIGEDDLNERIVLCRSEARGDKEEAIVSNAERRFIEDLGKLVARVEKGLLKNPLKIQRAIGRLQARHRRVQRYYSIELSEGTGDGISLAWKRNDVRMEESSELFGCYVLRTDERSLNEHQLWQLYISLTHAEDGFKAIKSDLGLRPNRHQKEERVDGHVFICVLAYQLLRNVLWTLEQTGDRRSWDTIKRVLRTHCYTTVILPTRTGETHHLRRSGQPDEAQKEIYRKLNVSWRALPHHEKVTTL
jgi:transposase